MTTGSTFNATEHFRHPEIELHDPPNLPDADRYSGEAAVRERVKSYLAVGWDGHYHVEEYLDAGEAVVVIFRVKVRTPHGGGLQLEEPFTQVLQFEDGKVRRIRQYLSRAEGLEAAGLRE